MKAPVRYEARGTAWLTKAPKPPRPEGRSCPRCTMLMSMYNTNRLCFQCTKELILLGKDPEHWRPSKKK